MHTHTQKWKKYSRIRQKITQIKCILFSFILLPLSVILFPSLTALPWLSSPQSVPSEPWDALKHWPAVTSRSPSTHSFALIHTHTHRHTRVHACLHRNHNRDTYTQRQTHKDRSYIHVPISTCCVTVLNKTHAATLCPVYPLTLMLIKALQSQLQTSSVLSQDKYPEKNTHMYTLPLPLRIQKKTIWSIYT